MNALGVECTSHPRSNDMLYLASPVDGDRHADLSQGQGLLWSHLQRNATQGCYRPVGTVSCSDYAHTHTHAHARTHARTHAHTHTHTQTRTFTQWCACLQCLFQLESMCMKTFHLLSAILSTSLRHKMCRFIETYFHHHFAPQHAPPFQQEMNFL